MLPPIQATPSGLSPTATSLRTFRLFKSTNDTVPLSALTTVRRNPSGDTSSRLLEEQACAGATQSNTAARTGSRRSMKTSPGGGRGLDQPIGRHGYYDRGRGR